jgi:hypothetical protein
LARAGSPEIETKAFVPATLIPLTAFDATSDTPPGPGTFSKAFKTSASFATGAAPRRLHLAVFCAEWARKSTGQ